ncbi:hypothetical protein ACFLSQ_07260 [Bacteroidota bacterium]
MPRNALGASLVRREILCWMEDNNRRGCLFYGTREAQDGRTKVLP